MKILYVLIGVLCMSCVKCNVSFAGDDTLTTPKPLISLTAEGIRAGFELYASTDSNVLSYSYYWLNSNGNRIYPYGGTSNGKQILRCRNWDSVPDVNVSGCVGVDDPHDCCTDVGVGTCDDVFDNANCVGDGDPLECCTGSAEGICGCWDQVKSTLGQLKNYLDNQVDLWEDIVRE